MNPFPKSTAKLDEEVNQEEQLLEFLKSNPEIMKKYQEELTKMQGQQKGRGPIMQPMTSKEYIEKVRDQTIQKCLDEEGGLVIMPDKGIVLKYFDRHSGEKIFVNVVKHPGVDHPEEKLLVDLDNQAGLRIPMSMGRVRQDNDKKGTPCKVIDVVMNDRIVEKAEKEQQIFYFMAQIIANYLLEKYKIAVSEDNIVKVNLKYKGNNVEIQRIRARKSPKIEEVQETKTKQQFEEEEKLLNQLSGQTGKKEKKPEFKIYGVDLQTQEKEQYNLESKGKIKSLEIQFDLSLLIHSRGIHLEASDRIVYLFVRGLYQICLRMPETIGQYRAIFAKKERVLKLVCTIKTHQHEQSAPSTKKVDITIENELLDELV